MSNSEAPVLHGEIHAPNGSQSNAASSVTSVGGKRPVLHAEAAEPTPKDGQDLTRSVGPDSQESPDSRDSTHLRLRAVQIDGMRSEWLELVDQYDVIAHKLRCMHIPLKKSWETNQALATSRMNRLVELHDRAHAEHLSMLLGESKLSAAQIRLLDTEVDSLAELLSTGMETLKTNITAMQSAAGAASDTPRVSPRDSGDTPELHRVYPAHSAESAPDSAAKVLPTAANELDPVAARRPRQLQRTARHSGGRESGRRKEMLANASLRASANELERPAPGLSDFLSRHGATDCTATTADYSDWQLTPGLLNVLIPLTGHRQAKNISFVQWSIRYMATKGQLRPMHNGTRNCGGYTKEHLFLAYEEANPEDPPIAKSVFNNNRVPTMGVLWAIATQLVTNTRAFLSGTSSLGPSLGDNVGRPAAHARRPVGQRRRRSGTESNSTDSASAESDSSSEAFNHSDSVAGRGCRRASTRVTRVSKKGRMLEGSAAGDAGSGGDEGGGDQGPILACHSGTKRRAGENETDLLAAPVSHKRIQSCANSSPPAVANDDAAPEEARQTADSAPPAANPATEGGGREAAAAACEPAAGPSAPALAAAGAVVVVDSTQAEQGGGASAAAVGGPAAAAVAAARGGGVGEGGSGLAAGAVANSGPENGSNGHCRLSRTKRPGNGKKWRLSGQGVFSVDGTLHTLILECDVEDVPKDGSCWAHAVLRSISALNIDLLEDRFVRSAASVTSESPDWATIVFSNLRAWKGFGEQSLASRKTTNFREHVARRLLDPQTAALCREHFQNGPSEDDLGAGGMAAARARATELGLAYDLDKPWHSWAIAMLNETTQFSAAVMQAMLRADFLGRFAVVTLSRKKVMKFDNANRLKPPKREFVYGFSPFQQAVLSGARFAIAVLQESADPSATLDDPEFDSILTEQAEAAAAAASAQAGGKRAARQHDPNAWKEGLPENEIMEKIRIQKIKLRGDFFKKNDAVSHFSQLNIVNGTDNLHVWILDKCPAGSTASVASVVVDEATLASDGSGSRPHRRELQSSDDRHVADDERRAAPEEAGQSADSALGACPSSPEGSHDSNDSSSTSVAEEILSQHTSSQGSDLHSNENSIQNCIPLSQECPSCPTTTAGDGRDASGSSPSGGVAADSVKPADTSGALFWNHLTKSLVDEYGQLIGVGDMAGRGHGGALTLNALTADQAAAMMECCRTTSLASYLKNPGDSHLPSLPVPVADLQAFISTAEWKAKRQDTILDWALLHLAGAAGCNIWDMEGIRKVETVPGFDDARTTGLVQKTVLVSGEVSRHLHCATVPSATAAALREHAIRTVLPITLIFTSAGKEGNRWVCFSISYDGKLSLLSCDTSSDKSDLHATLKKNVKAAFGILSNCARSPVHAALRSVTKGDMSCNAARTASFAFGGLRAATPVEAPRFMKVWIVTQIIRSIGLCRGRNLLQPVKHDSTESGGGSSGADYSGAEGGGSGGGGGGGETGGNGTNSNQVGLEPGGSGGPMPSVQRACGGAGDAPGGPEPECPHVHQPGAREGTQAQGNADDDERANQKLTQNCPSEETESDSDVEIEMGEQTIQHGEEEALELNLLRQRAEARARVIDAIRSGCAGRGLGFGSDKEQVVAKILEVYQNLDSEPMTLLSMDGDKICVLARYHGDEKRVLQPQGPLLPGGQFTIMISQHWRTKARVKNDPAFRHTYNALHMSSRTKHLAARGVTKIQQIRMFPKGASMAIFSRDAALSQRSLVLGATSIAYVEKGFWDSVRGEVVRKETLPLLQDTVREHVRNLLFAIDYFNKKGMALGHAAVNSAGIAENGAISFQDLSQSALFPETNEPHSRQAQIAMNILDKNNTSWSWKRTEVTEPGQPAPMVAHFLSDTTIQAMMQKERQSGKGLALPVSFPTANLAEPAQKQKSKKEAVTKGDAFRYDQVNVAHALAAVLRYPASLPTAAEFAALAVQISRTADQGQQANSKKALHDMINRLAGSKISNEHSQICSWKRCADFLVQSLGKKACSANIMQDHLFLTAFIPTGPMEEGIMKSGLRVEDSTIRFPRDWQLKPQNVKGKLGTGGLQDALQGKVLPAAVVKHESDLKGVGIFAGRNVGAHELVLLYIGELEYDSEIRPHSRMVVKKTIGNPWTYCFGIEDLTKCLEIGPALGQYANAPGPGERPNCTLERSKSLTYTDKTGKEFLVFPVYSDEEIAEGTPYLWDYPPSSGRGKSFT